MGRKKTTELKDLYNGEYVTNYRQLPSKRIDRLLRLFKLSEADIVADFGCGGGMLAEVIHDKIAQYSGVDFSEEFIKDARSRAAKLGINNASFECSDIVEFCGRNQERFDKVFTLDFSEHIYDETFMRIYTGILSSLKTGGKLFLHTPNGEFLLEILKRKGIMKQFPEHIAVRDAGEYLKLLQGVGFKSVDVHYVAHYMAPLSYLHQLSHIPFVGKLFKARLFIECTK